MFTLAATTVGLPIALYRLGGSPIPAHPAWHAMTAALMHRDDGSLFLSAVRGVTWLAWAAFTVAVLAEAQAALRGRPAPRLRLLGLQGAAARLVAVASVSFTTPGAVSLAAFPAPWTAPPVFVAHVGPAFPVLSIRPAAAVGAAQPVTLAALVKPAERSMQESARAAAAQQATGPRTVVVRPGDCLWTIAQQYLGSGDRYPELVRLNLGHEMGDSKVFTKPSLIMPGWELRLPGTTAPAGHSGSHAGPHPRPHHHGHPSGNKHFRDPHQGAGTGAGSTRAGGSQPEASASAPAASQASASASGASQASGQHEVQQVALFTLGMIAGAILVCLDRLRHLQRQHRRLGRRIALPADTDSQRIERKLRASASGCHPSSASTSLRTASTCCCQPRRQGRRLRRSGSRQDGRARAGPRR